MAPRANMNGEHTTHPPAQRQHYYPPSSASSFRGCCCCLFLLFFFLALLILAVVLVIVLAVKPKKPQFDLKQVGVQYMGITTASSPDVAAAAAAALSLNIRLVFSAVNPNKVGIKYEESRFTVMYRGIPLGKASVPGFYEGAHGERQVEANISVDRVNLLQADAASLVRDASLNDRVELRILGDIGAKIRVLNLDSPGVQERETEREGAAENWRRRREEEEEERRKEGPSWHGFRGSSNSIRAWLVVRCNAVKVVCLRKSRPKLSWMVVFQAFLCGLFGGSLAQNLYIESLALTSASFTAAISNLSPAMTFIVAICFRLEKPSLGTVAGKAKVFGIVVSIGGAMLLVFYKGVEIKMFSTNIDLLNHAHSKHGDHLASPPHKESAGTHLLGSLLALASTFSIVLWLNILTKMSKRYPYYYSSTALATIMGSVQAVVFSLCMERDRKEWKLGWNIRLLTVSYTGFVTSGVVVILIAWCVNVRGPLFVSVFSPLALVLIVLAGPLILKEKLYLGSILGTVLIVGGLYAMLWGKSEEMKKSTESLPSQRSPKSKSTEIVTTSENNSSVITV